MTTRRLAACSCLQLTATVEGEPVRVSVCHCFACQRRTGSVFGAQARFHNGDVTLAGEASEYIRTADSGNRVWFYFCPRCGSTVYYRLEGLEEFIAIPVGAFADPRFPPPGVSVYEERKHTWVLLPEDIRHHP